jgi:hypothetical protein
MFKWQDLESEFCGDNVVKEVRIVGVICPWNFFPWHWYSLAFNPRKI